MIKGYFDSMVRVPANQLSPEDFEFIGNSLTLEYPDSEKVLELWDYDDRMEMVSVPRAFVKEFQSRIECILEDRTSRGHAIGMGKKKLFKARGGQERAISSMVKYLLKNRDGNFIAPCGAGKTVIGAEIALRLGRSTCILVHKEFLGNQWEEAFKLICPELRVGWMQKDRVDYGKDFDVVIAVTQSVVNPKRIYPSEFYKSFGFFIGDEIHRYAADLWHTAIKKFPARYRLGLTATFRRGDGMMDVIRRHIGKVAVELQGQSLIPSVHFVRLGTTLERRDYVNRWDGELNRGKLISLLAKNENRSESITKTILEAFKKERKIFVLSERRAHLDWFAVRLQAYGVSESDIGFFVGHKGKDKQKKLEEAAKRSIVLATYQMAKEGLNIPDLDTLFLATPMVDVTQSVGRILREQDGKKTPLVVDYVDTGVGPCIGMKKARERLYTELGYDVH